MEEKTLDSRIVYKGKILDVKLDNVILPNGQSSTREVVAHPGAVAGVAIDEQGEVLLVRQYRYPVGQVLLEVPAGKLEKAENPLECAKRELAEETGNGAREWVHLSTFYTTPGFSDEIMYLYLAKGLYQDSRDQDEDEFIEVISLPLTAAREKVISGEIRDAKTIAGILLAGTKSE